MNIKEFLKPNSSPSVMSLVAAAGVDIGQWSRSKKGAVRVPSSNPAYCYEWAFTQPDRVVVVNLWYEEIEERNGQLSRNLNLREWSDIQRQSNALRSSQRSSRSRRASRMDMAIAYAYENQLPIRIIIGDGPRRDASDAKPQKPSRMERRLLDPEPWSAYAYDRETGDCRLVRGAPPIFVDQFSAIDDFPPNQREAVSKLWERDQKVREAVLSRAQGICEYCSQLGFVTAGGYIYLETHHVVALSEGGPDSELNVVAICPNDHRQAHYGEDRDSIREALLAILDRVTATTQN